MRRVPPNANRFALHPITEAMMRFTPCPYQSVVDIQRRRRKMQGVRATQAATYEEDVEFVAQWQRLHADGPLTQWDGGQSMDDAVVDGSVSAITPDFDTVDDATEGDWFDGL